ncbi:TonB-dependent receptor [Candidatus Poribacteria bacterium]|nr:TonB-dependent receptor [Candidatus Poribacteria bacterium]
MKLQLIAGLLVFLVSLPVYAQSGDVEGTVYQRSTEKPLAEANVRIIETEQTQKTDENGIFRFTELPEGTYTFIVTHPLESTPTSVSVSISSGDTTEIKIYLGEAVKLETIVVEGKRLPPTISRKDIRGSELLRIPGVANDALKGLTTLPSIGIPNDYFGVLYIRGREPGSNLYYLDRTPLGYPFHWGGLLSTISSETIEDIDIYDGGYGAEFGLDSQSVLDIHARDSIEERFDGKFNLNIFYSEGLLEGRVGDNGYISVSGRRSYYDLIAGPLYERQTGNTQQFPFSSDYQFKFAYPITERHYLTINAFAATDHFHFEAEEPDDEVDIDPIDFTTFFTNGFNGQGIHLRSNFTDDLRSYLSLTRSFNYLDIDADIISSETILTDEQGEFIAKSKDSIKYNLKVSVSVYTLREDVSYRLTPKLQLEPGFLLAFSPANSTEHSSFPAFEEEVPDDETVIKLLETDPTKVRFDDDGNARIRSTKTRDYEFGHDLQRAEGYLQTRYDPIPMLSVALGVRLDYLDVIEQLSVQPRGSISIKLPIGSKLRFAYGHYEQSPQLSQLLSENGNPALQSSLARHYIMELEHELSSQTEFEFATYYKDSQKLVTEDEVSNFRNQGTAFVGGVEAFLRHRIPDKFFGWISYAYTHAERRENPTVAYQPYLFDNTHIVSIVANYNFNPDFEIGAKWQYLSGTSEAPISTLILIQDPVTRGLNPLLAGLDRALSAELTPYHKLDLRISHKWNIRGVKIGGFIEVLNVYNRKNTIKFVLEEGTFEVQGEELEIEEQEVGEGSQLPLLPYFGLTLEF